jgi:SPP1 family predicted phage head-tail adaptor
MRAGRLDRRVILQRKTITVSSSGAEIETWNTLSTRWASVNAMNGDERFSAPQLVAKAQVEFQVRWSSDISDLSPQDRLVYPIVPETSPPTPTPNGSIYDIADVAEIGRREGFKIIAVRRADAA